MDRWMDKLRDEWMEMFARLHAKHFTYIILF